MRGPAMEKARAALAAAKAKSDRLASIEPYLIDLSLRENVFGSDVGQTLADKLANILLGTLDYAIAESNVPDDEPILGANAYRLTLDFFRQTSTRFMDLPPDVIGGTYGYRVCPLAADKVVLAGRLSEVTGRDPISFPADTLEMMIRIMRRDLRSARKIAYDEPTALLDLYARAGGKP